MVRCLFIKPDNNQCGCHSVKGKTYCHHHHRLNEPIIVMPHDHLYTPPNDMGYFPELSDIRKDIRYRVTTDELLMRCELRSIVDLGLSNPDRQRYSIFLMAEFILLNHKTINLETYQSLTRALIDKVRVIPDLDAYRNYLYETLDPEYHMKVLMCKRKYIQHIFTSIDPLIAKQIADCYTD